MFFRKPSETIKKHFYAANHLELVKKGEAWTKAVEASERLEVKAKNFPKVMGESYHASQIQWMSIFSVQLIKTFSMHG